MRTRLCESRYKFIYFIQKKGFINGDSNYLNTKLGEIQSLRGPDRFYEYFRDFLLPFFHQGLGTPTQDAVWADPAVKQIAGEVPYVDGGIFERHDLERAYEISIPDEAFETIFDFFDQWRWHLDELPTGQHNEINPDILGFIFEQYVNYTEKGRKEKGAYYTKPDVTGYMSTYTIIPAVVDRLVNAGLDDPAVLFSALETSTCTTVWATVSRNLYPRGSYRPANTLIRGWTSLCPENGGVTSLTGEVATENWLTW